MAEFEFGTVEEAPKAPHIYAPVIEKLIRDTEANPKSVIFYTAEDEESAKLTLRKLQAAAKEQDRSAVRRSVETLENGHIKVAVAVRDKITRNRGGADEAEEVAAVAEAVEATPAAKPAGKGK